MVLFYGDTAAAAPHALDGGGAQDVTVDPGLHVPNLSIKEASPSIAFLTLPCLRCPTRSALPVTLPACCLARDPHAALLVLCPALRSACTLPCTAAWALPCPAARASPCPVAHKPPCPATRAPSCPAAHEPPCPAAHAPSCPAARTPPYPAVRAPLPSHSLRQTPRAPPCPAARAPPCPAARALPCPAAHALPCPAVRALPCPAARTPCSPQTISLQQLREWVIQRGRPGGGGCGAGGTGHQRQSRHQETLTPQQLREWAIQRGHPGAGGTGQQRQQRQQETLSPQQLCKWVSQRRVPGSADATSLGAYEPGSTGTAYVEALHTFMLNSGAPCCFFRDCTTVTPLTAPVAVSLADPLARASTIFPCLAAPSGSLAGLHLPSFSKNLVSNVVLQDKFVTVTTPGGELVAILSHLL
ncbi:unnamed protein product [Closterium sp. NIES-54]